MLTVGALGALALGCAILGVGAVRGASGGARVAAHRGGAQLAIENSLQAFRRALALGVDFIETDVHLTRDGEVVVLHDPTLDRTTTASGPVRAASAATLASARLRARSGAVCDEPIPSLDALLSLLGPSAVGLLLEIKVDERGAPYPGIEDTVVALVGARGMAARTVVMAFEPDTLARVRVIDAGLRTALLVGSRARGRGAAAAVRRAAGLGAWGIGMHHRLVDADAVAAARAAGLAVAAWTVNDAAELRRVIGLGVDVVISDRPDLALRALGR